MAGDEIVATGEVVAEQVTEQVAESGVMVSVPGLIYLLIIFALIFLLYEKGKKAYTPLCEALDKKDYPLRALTVIGFAFMDLIKYKYNTSIDRKLRRQLLEIKEAEYVEFFLRATWATGATYFLVGCMISGALAAVAMELMIVFAVFGFALLLAYTPFMDLENKIKERHNSIVMDLPDFSNKLLILSGAGLSVYAAIVKVSREMTKDTPFYNALRHSVYLMENGGTPSQAMDDLNNSCNIPEVRRMTSVLLQNMRSGGSEVILLLRELSKELWNNRRANAKKIAEEAGTKLLFPMMIMLLAVILIVGAPAIMSLSLT